MSKQSDVHQSATAATAGPYRMMALGAVAGPIVLTLAWIVLGLLRPATPTLYGVHGGVTGLVTSPISGLGVGPHGYLFNTAFVLSGLLTMIGLAGVAQTLQEKTRATTRWLCGGLLALSPLGYIVAGIFTLENAELLHFAGFLLVVATPLVSFPVAGLLFRRIPRWHRLGNWLFLGIPMTLLLTIFFLLSFNQEVIASGRGIAGVPSRLLALEIGAWHVAMGWLAFRRPGQTALIAASQSRIDHRAV